MNLPKLTLYSRKAHRLLVVLVVILSLVMIITGTVMKYPDLLPLDPFLSRRIHNIVSTFFSIVLFCMMVTGGFLYLFPWLVKLTKKPQPQ